MADRKGRRVRAKRTGRIVLDTAAEHNCDGFICLVHELDSCVGVRKNVPRNLDRQIDAPRSSIHTAPARRTILHPKENSEDVLIICAGWATRSIMTADGRRQILSFLLPGDLISAATLFEPMPMYFVDAITEVVYRKFKQSELKAALFKHPGLMEKLWKIWANERAQADQMAINISRNSADRKIAWLILNLAGRNTKRGVIDRPSFDFPLRQRHIADATGLTDVYVGKILGDFKSAGLIETKNRSLRIIDKEQLRAVAGL